MIGLGWTGNWREAARPDHGPLREAGVWIELIDSGQGRRLLVFPQPPAAAEIFQAAGWERPAVSLPATRIPDRTTVLIRRSSGRVECRPLSEGLSLALGRKMNLNRASVRDLVLLPGLGPATARLIAADRAAHGPFSSVNDLTRVKGLGRKKAANLRPWACVSFARAGREPLNVDGGNSGLFPAPH